MVAETYKHDGVDWRLITAIQYTDSTLIDRNLTEVWYNDQGSWLKVFDTIAANAVSLDPRSIVGSRDTSGGLGTATAGYELSSDGIAKQLKNSGSNTDSLTLSDLFGDNWWTGKPQVAIGLDYEVRATQTASAGPGVFTGLLGVWSVINTFELWTFENSGNNVEINSSVDLLIEIRYVATMTVQASATIVLRAFLFGP